MSTERAEGSDRGTPRRDAPGRGARRPDGAGSGAQVHRALASPVRGQLLALLRDSEQPLDVHTLAAQLGLHPNPVRAHLVVLAEAGLVSAQPQPRERPGRPRLAYRATDAAAEVAAESSGGYRLLAEILASYLAGAAPDPGGAAEQAGSAWGRYLVERPAPFQTVPPHAAVERIVALLADLGFTPELDDSDPGRPRVLLRRCPFLDVAKDHQEVVCNVHLGLMRGALAELGVDVEARDLLPFVEPGLCVSHLEVPA